MHSPDFIAVTARGDWLAPAVQYRITPGATIAQILDECGVSRDLQVLSDVAINGEIIPPEIRRLVRPKVGTAKRPIVVTIHPPPLHGGKKSTAKNVITLVASIALVAGTAFIGAGGLAVLGASASIFGAGTAGAAIAAAGFGIAGQIALNALAPPPLKANSGQTFKQDTIAGINGNPVAPFEYLPRVLGTMTLSPPFVAQPWSRYTNGVVEVNAIVGLAGNTDISNILINGSPISSFDEIDYETRDGSSTVTDLTLVTECGFEQPGEALTEFDLVDAGGSLIRIANQGDPDSSKSQYHVYRSVGVADEINLRLAFPAGIYINGDLRARMAFRIELRRAGTSTWIKGPEIHFAPIETWAKPFRQRIALLFQAITGGAVTSSTGGQCANAYGYTGSASYNWQANSYFRDVGTNKPAKNVKIDDDGIKIYLAPSTFPADKYEIRIRRSILFSHDKFDSSAYTWDGSTAKANFFDHYLNGSTYEVRINQSKYVGQAQVEAVTTIRYQHPIGDKTGLTLIAIKARKTRINSISATFKSKARTYNGTTWSSTFAITDNPAALYREVLIGELNSRPLAASMVDDFALGLAYLDCATRGYTCNGVLQGYSVEQALQAIAAAAYGVPRQEETWSILLERDTSAQGITQLFSPRNYANLSIEKAFEPLPHAIRAIFNDRTNDYRAEETIVYAPGYNAGNATLYQSITYDTLTLKADVDRRALFDLRQLLYRQTRYLIDVDWSHLVSSRGSLVGLETDEIVTAASSAYISQIIRSGTNVTGLILDAAVNSPLIDIGVAIQYADGTTVIMAIYSVDNSQTITFLVPFADPGPSQLAIGNLVVVGNIDRPTKRCKIFNIERLGDLQARLTLLDEAPEIYA